MPMIGSSAPAAAAYDPSQLSGADRLMMVGAMLRDAASAARGGDSQNVMGVRNYLAQRQMMNNVLGTLNGGSSAQPGAAPPQGAPAGAPTASPNGPLDGDFGPNAPPPQQQQSVPLTNDVRAPAAPAQGGSVPGVLSPQQLLAMSFINPQGFRGLVEEQKMLAQTAVAPDGTVYRVYDPSNVGRVFRNPSAVNNTIVDLNDRGNTNRVIPSAPVAGAMPVYNNLGQVVDWTLPQGTQNAIRMTQQPAMIAAQAKAAEVPIAAANSRTQAAAQANTASQNVIQPPRGFVVRQGKR